MAKFIDMAQQPQFGQKVGVLIEQALAANEDFGSTGYMGLMAGSCASVWAVGGAIWYFATKERDETQKPLVADDGENLENTSGAIGVSSLSVLLSIPALFAH